MEELESVGSEVWQEEEQAEEEEQVTSDCTGVLPGERRCRAGAHLFGGLYGSRSCFEKALTLSAPRTS